MRREPDRLETRCRELALAAGIDPDSRISKTGSPRGMPAWCGFRQAVQEAVSAERAKEAADQLIIPPQAPEYQNSPLTIFGEPDEGTIQQIKTCMQVGNVVGAALCGDAHIGYAQPVGGVLAYDGSISISGVGYDISCGCLAVKTNLPFREVKNRIPQIVSEMSANISFGLGSKAKHKMEHAIFDDKDRWIDAGIEELRKVGVESLSSVGTGNHYVDVMYEKPTNVRVPFERDDAPVWIGVHFGSRGVGYKATQKYLKLAGGKEGMFIAPTVLSAESELGQLYIKAMEIGGDFAYAGRGLVIAEMCRILGADILDTIENHHNYGFWEEHNGRKLRVVRKGATPAFPGQRGFVGGSMGDDAVIIEGVDSEKSRASFYSTIHGAGRIMSRTQAKKAFTRTAMEAWLRERRVTLIGGDLDESPMAYRRLDEVLNFHDGTIKINHRLHPFIVAMAGSEVYDPYKGD